MLHKLASRVSLGSHDSQHIISSPTIKKTSDISSKKREISRLATAFENAWKIGNLTENVSDIIIILN